MHVHHSYQQPRDADGRKFVRRITPSQQRAIRANAALPLARRRKTRDLAAELGVSHMTVSRYARLPEESDR
jgi:DNA-binding transcriptional MocR family regulator